MTIKKSFAIPFVLLAFLSGCKDKIGAGADVQETAQQVGDVMASIDEASGHESGEYAQNNLEGLRKSYTRLSEQGYGAAWTSGRFLASAIPSAEATRCFLSGGGPFGACDTSSATVVRTFDNCTVGPATFSGTVSLHWSNNTPCAMQAAGQYVTRSPDFSVTGRRSSTLKVSRTGLFGQKITRSAGSANEFDFESDGINRKFTNGAGAVTFDQTTTTTSPIHMIGKSRSARSLNQGILRVTNNLSAFPAITVRPRCSGRRDATARLRGRGPASAATERKPASTSKAAGPGRSRSDRRAKNSPSIVAVPDRRARAPRGPRRSPA